MIIWIIGLSGAGKTTIGRIAAQNLREQGLPAVLLDGDDFREALGTMADFDVRARETNSLRMMRFSLLLEKSDVVVVACFLSIFPEHRTLLRESSRDYIEVFVDAPIEDLMQRDYKGLYRGALSGNLGNVVGVDIHFPVPESPDLVLKNDTNSSDTMELATRVSDLVCERLSKCE